MEEQFRRGWRRITELARERCGSGGSCLFQAADGTWTAIARWPDRAARTACFEGGPLDAEAEGLIAGAVAERLEGLELEAVEDLWAPFVPAGESTSRTSDRLLLVPAAGPDELHKSDYENTKQDVLPTLREDSPQDQRQFTR